MNITVNHHKLSTAIKSIERIVSKNLSLPILNAVLIKTDKNKLRLSTTNLEIGINYWIGAKIEKEGEIAVPAKLLSGFLTNTDNEKIILTSNNDVLNINSGHSKTKILGFNTKDFPIIPGVIKENSIVINPQDLKEGLSSVLDAVLLSETRPELSGIFININKNKIEFAATDSSRLSEKIINLSDNELEKQFILPRNTAIEVIRILENSEIGISLVVSENQILFYNNDFELISRLIDGRYPEYKKIIPDKVVSIARLNKAELEKNIRAASVFASSIYDIKLKIGIDKTEINAQNNERGETLTTLPSELKNTPFEVSLNYNYILDGLKNIKTSNVILQFTGDGSPLIMRPENQKNYTYLIMPLRA